MTPPHALDDERGPDGPKGGRLVGRERGIEVENLVREFRHGPRAVDGIDLRVEPGEVYGFLGPNGAGKSTTVLMLTTLLPPTSGTATVAGYDIVHEGPQVRASIGAALQEAALDPYLTGRVVELTDDTVDPALWGKNFPLQYDGYLRTV